MTFMKNKLLDILCNSRRRDSATTEQSSLTFTEGIVGPHLSNRHALAKELGNYTPDSFLLARYDADIDQKLKVDAFKVALRAAHEELDLADFPFQLDAGLNQDNVCGAAGTESDTSTLVDSEPSISISKTAKPVDMISLDEIYSNKRYDLTIPPLLIKYTEIIGSERLAYNHNATISYDYHVEHMDDCVQSRGVTDVPRTPGSTFYKKHAVRAFLQIPDIPEIHNRTFYRYLGDYFIVKTNHCLSRNDWDGASEYVKDQFVARFIEVHNKPPTGKFRAQNNYTPATTRNLLNRGQIYPLISLQQAHQAEEAIGPFLPVTFNNKELELFVSSAPKRSIDSASLYSQDSAPRDDGESGFEFYTSAVNLEIPSSPVWTNPFASNVIITHTRAQEFYPANDAEDHGVERDASRDDSEDDSDNQGDNYDESNFGDDHNDEHSGSSCWSDGSDDEIEVQQDRTETLEDDILSDHDSPNATIVNTATTVEQEVSDIQRSGEDASKCTQAVYDALEVLCADLEETSYAYTPMARAQRRFIEQYCRRRTVSRISSDHLDSGNDGSNGVRQVL